MTTGEFLEQLSKLDIQVKTNGASLRLDAPKGVLTPALRRELTQRKEEILIVLRDHDVQRTLERTRLAQMLRQGDLPLSFTQQRLWFLDQLEPGSSAYTIAAWRRFSGSLDLTALTNAFTELVRRHESLRTTFVNVNGEPAQRIADPYPVTLDIINLENIPQVDRPEVARQTMQEQAQRGFDLARGPLFRSVLIRLSPDEHDLFIMVHHIVADGWSVNIIARELMALYEAGQTGQPLLLPEPPLQYADFALWQRQQLTGEAFETQRRYWREQLSGGVTPLELLTDHVRSHQLLVAGASHEFVLVHPLAERLGELSRGEGATLFMTLLAAFNALLARYTGQEDIVVGSPIANRNHVELESVVGFFANTLVLRTNLEGDPTFRELLARVCETCLGAYAHPDMPFEKLVEELQPERTLGQNPLFQVSFAWQEAATGADLAFVSVASPFDLTLFVRDGTDGTLRATVQYRSDLFEPETITRFVNHYCTLLEGVAADPDCRLSELPLLDEAETQRLLIEYNATSTVYPCERSVHGLFEDQVDATPNAVALVSGDALLTYRELDRRANRLAHYLCTLGVGPEGLVGVWMERSVDMIVALLGILKAGGAYVPFDLQAPPERLAFMESDAKVALLLTHEHMLDSVQKHELRTICLDGDSGNIQAQPDTRLGVAVCAENLAYVMYTSGSTGEPKGVAITHRGVVRLVKNTDYAHFGPDEVFLQVAALAFDASTFEIWGALLNGSRLAIAPPGVLSLEELGSVIVRYGVTTLWLTAGLFHQVVDLRVEILRPVRQLLAGGDVLSPVHVQRVLAALPRCRLINGYGPTEGATFTCCHTITPATAGRRTIPIGRPIANTRVYVLDRFLRPAPIGVPGELWIAGDGVARGYINRPELTAKCFVTHRFSEMLQERLYRSGDLVRWLNNGELEFLGRLDEQVKVRGFRVEVGEIEATLGRHPNVQESIVVAHPTEDGDKRLVAYVVAKSSLGAHDFREFLGSKLPDYMIPAAFVALDLLPLTVNGKIDRQALPEPEPDTRTVDSSDQPRDELERQLVKIWQNILSVSSVGINDSFFDLGGHSLLAVRLFAQLEERLQVILPLVTLFRTPTIASLAGLIREGVQPTSGRSLVPIQSTGSRPPVFGMPGVQGTVFIYNALAQLIGPNQPFYGLQSRGLDGVEKPFTRIEDIAAAFLHEIRLVQSEGPYYLIGMCMGGVIAYEMAQQLHAVGQQVGLLVLLETWVPETTAARQLRLEGRSLSAMRFVVDRLRLYWETFTQLSGRERRQYLLGRLQLLKEILVQRDLFRGARGEFHLGIVTQANHLAFQQYKPQVYSGPVALFCAEGRQVAPAYDYRLAWRELITGKFEVYSVPGDNSGQMLMMPQVRLLAAQLKTCLNSAQASLSLVRRVDA
jgi:aspartate racemase